ncbi:succinate dehydrogenase hydrophobic membrane anchor subunit [Rathayibacter soli]|uniref:succinate dehydrogenase hydrophobic membrane anchor subunit n=1 Tax=Rathayibacter soli TaxID=3144168 RepID=UPI0027E46A6C|nr:succinate dehydrogenase hydrophobic membrane anchor subunit [Glaciibacter superstes]
MTTIDAPRTPTRPVRKGGVNWEKWGWMYMRVSGVLLVVLIFGHLFVNLVLGQGIKAIDFAFVGGKWSDPFWQVWDGLMLWLALIHGGNGMRTLINDYARNGTVNRILKFAVLAAVVILIAIGTYTVTVFNPCPSGTPANLLPDFCATIGK